MVLVYRYEKQGIGPYNFTNERGSHSSEEERKIYSKVYTGITNKHTNANGFCGAGVDFDNFISYAHFCACPSIKSLRAWFKGFNATLLKAGFELVEYTVEESILSKSGKQCIYHKDMVISKRVIKSNKQLPKIEVKLDTEYRD